MILDIRTQWLKASVVVLSGAALCGCATTGKSPAEQRQIIQSMASEVLTDLYAMKDSARAEVSSAPGYAVFSNANVNLLVASFAGGQGLVKNNRTGKTTFMNMGEVGLGLGAGIKDYRVVFVFHDNDTLQQFIESGWAFGGQADAAAKAGDKGAAVGGEAVINGATVYQLTESGLALQATLKGTKFWPDADLN